MPYFQESIDVYISPGTATQWEGEISSPTISRHPLGITGCKWNDEKSAKTVSTMPIFLHLFNWAS